MQVGSFNGEGVGGAMPAPGRRAAGQSALARVSSILMDGSGAVSREDKIAAFREMQNLAKGGLMAFSEADRALAAQARKSDIVQSLTDASRRFGQALADMNRTGVASESVQATLDLFNNLSPAEQELVAAGRFNDRSVDEWKAWMEARVGVYQIIERAGDGGATQDPRLATARQLAEQLDTGKVDPGAYGDWTKRATDLLGRRAPIRDIIDLSPEARAHMAGGYR